MYRVKQGGRNGVSFYSAPAGLPETVAPEPARGISSKH
jgi:hypothetical protein